VLYDRSTTAMTRLTESTFSWAEEVRGAKVALSTGITCALGPEPAQAVGAFLAAARRAGARTVFDVNHRARLWTWEQSVPVLRRVLPQVDVLFTSRYDLLRLVEGATAAEGAVELGRRAIKQWGHRVVVLRDSDHSVPGRVTVTATALTAEEVLTSSEHEAQVVDPFGAGDAALAAFVAAWLSGGGLGAAPEASAWACAFQHTVVGDACQIRAADLQGRDQTWGILR
jgi:2-dehydro-3-deoxygluconokinase